MSNTIELKRSGTLFPDPTALDAVIESALASLVNWMQEYRMPEAAISLLKNIRSLDYLVNLRTGDQSNKDDLNIASLLAEISQNIGDLELSDAKAQQSNN